MDEETKTEVKPLPKQPEAQIPPSSDQIQPPPPAKRTPSFWARALRFVLSFLVVFGLGVLAALFLLYIPARQEIGNTQKRFAELKSQVNSDQTENDQENDRLSILEEENINLQSDLDQANQHVIILTIRLDIVNAQLALEDEDPAKARLALSKTSKTFAELAELLPTNQRSIVDDMQTRLKLVQNEIDDDANAALSDLEILASNLIELENVIIR
jgi:hypothetical protein